MAVEGEVLAEEVRSYFDKHKIASLFEDLKCKVIKDLPDNPIDYLITKLQALQQKKKATPTRPATTSGVPASRTKVKAAITSSIPGPRSKIQVTGTSLLKTTGTTTSRPSTTKTTPSSSKTAGVSGAKTPTRPTSTGGVKGKTTVAAPSGSKLKPTTSFSPSSKRPTTAPSVGSAKSPRTQSKLSSPTKQTSLRTPSKLSTSTSSSGTSTPRAAKVGLKTPASKKVESGSSVKNATQSTQISSDKSKLATKTPQTGSSKKPDIVTSPEKTTSSARNVREASAEEIAEFFGEPKKLSAKPLKHDDSEDMEELSKPITAPEESDDESSLIHGKQDLEADACEGVDIEKLLQMKMSLKQGRKKHSKKKARCLLHPGLPEDETPSSLGYHSGGGEGGEESEEDECVQALEDASALEDEGVTGLSGGTALLSKDAKVDFMVLLCSRCAKILTGDEPTTEVSAIVITREAGTSEFESASQVGSHTSFPQWEIGTEVDSNVSPTHKWKGTTQSNDSASDVTLQSHDTWGGLAPPARQNPSGGTSDEESELQLPPPPPLDGRAWIEDPPHPHDPHGWSTGEQM